MKNITELSKKQLSNMTSEDLEALLDKAQPVILKNKSDAKKGLLSEADYHFTSKLKEAANQVREELFKRERIESSKKPRDHKRGSRFDKRNWKNSIPEE